METNVELGLTMVLSIVVFAAIFAAIVYFGKKFTDEQNTKENNSLSKC